MEPSQGFGVGNETPKPIKKRRPKEYQSPAESEAEPMVRKEPSLCSCQLRIVFASVMNGECSRYLDWYLVGLSGLARCVIMTHI